MVAVSGQCTINCNSTRQTSEAILFQNKSYLRVYFMNFLFIRHIPSFLPIYFIIFLFIRHIPSFQRLQIHPARHYTRRSLVARCNIPPHSHLEECKTRTPRILEYPEYQNNQNTRISIHILTWKDVRLEHPEY